MSRFLLSACRHRHVFNAPLRAMSTHKPSPPSPALPLPPTQPPSHRPEAHAGTAATERRHTTCENGDVNPNFVQPVARENLLTIDGRFHNHDWKPAVSKLQPIQPVRQNAAARLIVRHGPPPGGGYLSKEHAVDPQVISMFFGWLGNTYKAFHDRAREADYSLAILRHVIDDIRICIGRPKLRPGQFGEIVAEITRRCLVVTRELGVRDYTFAMRDDTTLPWLQVQRDVYIMVNGEYPVTDRPEYMLQRHGHTPAQITYLFRNGELVGNAAVQYAFSEEVWQTFIHNKYVATIHAEVDESEKVTALFIDLADTCVGVRFEFSEKRDPETAPMGGISLQKSLPLSLFECIITGFADCLIDKVSDAELTLVAKRVNAELERFNIHGIANAEEFHLLKALNHLTAYNWHLKALMISEFRGRLMEAEQSDTTDVVDLIVSSDIRPAKIAGQTPNGLGIHGKREKDTLTVIVGSLAYMVATAITTFKDDLVSEGLKVLPTGFGVAAALAAYYHTVVHRRSLKDFVIGLKEHATLSDAIRYNRKEDVIAGLLAKRDIDKMVDTEGACYLGSGGKGSFKADITIRASELAQAGAEFGISGRGELCYRRGDLSDFPWYVVNGDDEVLHVSTATRKHVTKLHRLAADPVVAGTHLEKPLG